VTDQCDPPPANSPRRFQSPWTVTPIPAGFRVDDATGRAVAYVYGEGRARGVNDDGLTVDQARRIASCIARLPALLGAAGVIAQC
jgi:hypothetical protein